MQALNIKIQGLYTHPNPLSQVPPGGLVKAKNVVIDKEGIVETRRGLKKYGSVLTLTGSQKINALLNYQDTVLVHYGTTLAYDSDDAGTWSNYSGTYTAPTGANALRGIEANKNFYFNASDGIKKLDSVTTNPVAAGVSKALDGSGALTGVSGFLSTANQIAYRIVWGISDANSNLLLGAPSQRIVIANASGGSRDIALTFTVPAGITTSHFYQVYRSLASGGVATVPNDELGLVYENNPTSGEISALSVTITDSTPESLRGATLYTSPSQEGISQANDQPPLCADMALYKNSVLFANTTSKQRLQLTLLAVGGSTGVVNDDTITIGGVTFTGKASETASSGQFKITSGGTPADNIDATAQSLVRVINQYASNTLFYATYISGYNDLPGKMLIEERAIGGSTIAVTSSRGGAFNPALPTSGTTISTSSDAAPNRVYVSKPNQPESVPLLNYIPVGSANKKILRILALRDSVFVFKEDGVFRITGESISSFYVSLFDITVILTAPESAVAFNNQIYAYTSQGVVAVSDTGSAIMSRPIEMELLPISTFTNFSSLTFGIAYNSDRKYILFTQNKTTDTYPKKAWVYNSITNAWTDWEMNRGCGIVNSDDDKLYLGSADSAYVYQEKKAFALTDYSDDELTVTVTGSTSTVVTLTSTVGIVVGAVLVQGGKKSEVMSIDSLTQITVADEQFWNPGTATVYSPISVEVETVPQHAGNPGILKHYRDTTTFFRKANFSSLNIGFKSNISSYVEKVAIVPLSDWGWGQTPWGQYGWGGTSPDLQPIRTYVPRNKQRCHWFAINVTHNTPNNYFAIAGWSMNYENMSDRIH